MSSELFEWLRYRWTKDNHPKYHHLFHEWVSNITEDQIKGFDSQEKKRNVLSDG